MVPYISNILRNGAFRMNVSLLKQLTAFSRELFTQKGSITDIQLGSEYASRNKYRNLTKNARFSFILIVKK